ncbi:SRPBCC family protein [Methanolobus sediminis]|uniref:SRPBCC family protein n=1 Tax=Methanolobus sediminis TaxID=3072978 RepID=A0AA51UN74_9EURY|nr:SRPBCC family protein [Methanolobus sediminis]WMW25130.1 SRPBCC family protein [Methanolobus sediminis]
MKLSITIQAIIKAPVEDVWKYYTEPEHIIKWNSASDDWHTPKAENNLKIGGEFNSRMEAKDGSAGFNFKGTYTNVKENELIEYVMEEDNRKVKIEFRSIEEGTEIILIFEPETELPIEMQRDGWQSILNNFKKYVEENN